MAAGDGLSRQYQEDFSAGSILDVARHLIDPRGARKIINGLLAEDGAVIKRGPSRALSSDRFDDSLRWIWDGYLSAGRRTIFASAENFGVLGADDETPVDLGGDGLTKPVSAKEIEGLLFIPPGIIYGGSRKEADYSTGTVAVTNGSPTVTGSGTSWSANVDPGMLFRLGTGGRIYVVAEVAGNTSLTLTESYAGATDSGEAYSLKRLETANSPYPSSDIYSVGAERLFVNNGDNGVAFSNRRDPHTFSPNDFHTFDEGAKVRGHESISEAELVFTTQGMYAIRGIALSLTDADGNAQQTLDLLSRELVLWGQPGIASYQGSLVVPMTDGAIYLLDGVSSPERVSDAVQSALREHIDAGHEPGGAIVYRDHYFLPILSASGTWEDLLICRLDRPVETAHGVAFPWTFGEGAGAEVAALTARAADTVGPKLLAAGNISDLVDPETTDDFSADSIAAGSLGIVSGSAEIDGGALELTAGSLVRLPDTYLDFEHTIKFTLPDPPAIMGVAVGKQAGPNIVSASYDRVEGVGSLVIYAPDGTQLAGDDADALEEDDVRWLRFVLSEDDVTAQLWSTDPTLGGSPDVEVESALGSYASTVGSEVLGRAWFSGDVSGGENPLLIDDQRIQSSIPGGGAVLDLSGYFAQESTGRDHDGIAPRFEIETRDFRTGALTVNRVRRLRLVRELLALPSVEPRISADAATGRIGDDRPRWDLVNWDEFEWAEDDLADWRALPFGAGPDEGINAYTWYMARRGRYIRFRLRSSDPVAKLVIRSIEVFTAETPHDRIAKVVDR